MTVSQGIETDAERQACIELGVKLGQGYLIERPSPPYDLFSIAQESLPDRCVFVKLRLVSR